MPSQSGIRAPAEWEAHSAVWLAWPYDKISFGTLNHKNDQFNPERLPQVQKEFLKIISALKDSEPVHLIVKNKKEFPYTFENVKIFESDYADVWTRDYLPTFVMRDEEGELVAIKWRYDAYGEKFDELIKDNRVWAALNKMLCIKSVEPEIILEAGAIEMNGRGTLITTEQCLLKRNPHLTKQDYEQVFAKYLGVTKTIWLKAGLVSDHTDGHIDEIARFVAPNKIVCAFEDDANDENYEIVKANYENLKNAVDAQGEPFELVKLPMPHMRYDSGEKAPVSYANFYIGNKVVLAPIFKDSNDANALNILGSCFLDRQIIPIDCSDIIYGGGAIHCMTQQQPAI